MTTEEAYDAQVTRLEAEREIMRDNCEPAEFFAASAKAQGIDKPYEGD